MSTDSTDQIEEHESILTPYLRRQRLLIPKDLSAEELARDWTLTTADKEIVNRCRKVHRQRFAVEMCVLRNYGRFVQDYVSVPVRIINHIGHQLGMAPVLFISPADRDATKSEHRRWMREYLDYESFTAVNEQRLCDWLKSRAATGLTGLELFNLAEKQLKEWKVVIPAPTTLEKVVAPIVTDARRNVFGEIAERLTASIREALDELLEVPEGERTSPLFDLKKYPPDATARAIRNYINRFQMVSKIGVDQLGLDEHRADLIAELGGIAKRYDVSRLKNLSNEDKKYALVICFLVETQKTILDHIVAMHDSLLTSKSRDAKRDVDKKKKEISRRFDKGLATLITAGKTLAYATPPEEVTAADMMARITGLPLTEAIGVCEEYRTISERGYADQLCARYKYLRRYLRHFYRLPLEAEPGSEALIEAIELVRLLDDDDVRPLPLNAPIEFVPKDLQPTLQDEHGAIHRPTWEIALAFAIRDALRAGDLYLPASRSHVSFWNLVYNEEQWIEERDDAYEQLKMPPEAAEIVARLRAEFDKSARKTDRGLSKNSYASIVDGKLVLKKDKALFLPKEVSQIQRVLDTHMGQIRVEDMVMAVDSWCHFSDEFTALGDQSLRVPDLYRALLAALLAQATNLGISAMAQSVPGLTVEALHTVSKWLIREETLRAANKRVVDFHHGLEMSAVYGDGHMSSSDGQRFIVQSSSLMRGPYPRYFGHYDRAVSVYTHVSDQHSVFSTQVISCGPREALWVLDGLLGNDTLLRPRVHTTDTAGYIEQLFALCYLLGISFRPRIKDLKDQQLYKAAKDLSYRRLDQLFKASTNTGLIGEQWDQLIRIAASLVNRTAPAHVVIRRLQSSTRSDKVAKALTQLGRLVKTIYILRYIRDEKLRREVQIQLNRGEFRHKLARYFFFANQGEFQTGDYAELMCKASCLSLLCNIALVWNTVKISEIVGKLRASGEMVLDEHLARISPLMHAHIIPNGTYFFRRQEA